MKSQSLSNSHLDLMVYRTKVITNVYCKSMDTEFWHSDDAVEDWKKHLQGLHDIVWPTHSLITQLSELDNEVVKGVRQFSNKILASIRSLGEFQAGRDNSVTAILKALRFVRSGLGFLETEKLSQPQIGDYLRLSELSPAILAYPGITNAEFAKKIANNQMGMAVGSMQLERDNLDPFDIENNKQDVNSCMASRGYYLTAHYCAFFHPDLWRISDFENYVDLHEDALKKMLRGTQFSRSVEKRLLDVKRRLNPNLIESHRLAG